MSVSVNPARPMVWRWLAAALLVARDIAVGTLLCLTPIGAMLALGWITRRMGTTIRARWGTTADAPGWVLGPRGAGWMAWLLGGLAANVRAGLMALIGLGVWTLPVTLAWLGAWWAGWENSFNKGYEQASVGPAVWAFATLLFLPVLVHSPLALAHAAQEDRLGAMFEIRRIRSLARVAGWRLAGLALVSVLAAFALLGLRVVPVFIEGVVPEFAAMTVAQQLQIANGLDLLSAFTAFTAAAYLRWRAASVYAAVAPRAAAHRRFFLLWEEHPAARLKPETCRAGRVGITVWLGMSGLIWATLPVLIVIGQFMNYSPVLWLSHPVVLLPWWP